MKTIVPVLLAIFAMPGCAFMTTADEVDSAQSARNRSGYSTHLEQRINSINFATANVGEAPKKYKKRIKKAIRFALNDPDNVKFSGFTTPRKEVLADRGKLIYGYAVCVLVDEKMPSGDYTGDILYWVFMRDNDILRIKNTQNPQGKEIFPGRSINCN